MPFAEMPRGIPCLLQSAGQHWGLGVEPVRHPALSVFFAMGQERCDLPTLRVRTRGDCDARRGTDRRVDVELLKGNSLGGHAVDVGCFGIRIAETGKIGPAHVIDEHQDDVRLVSGLNGGGRSCQQRDDGGNDREQEIGW